METQELNVCTEQGSLGCPGNPPEDPSLKDRWDALPEDAQEKILKKHRDWNVEGHDWWDACKEMFVEDMKAKGVRVDDTQFSGFWSQGDGAAFSGKIEDFPLFMKSHDMEKYLPLAEFAKSDTSRDFYFRSSLSWRCNNCMSFDYELDVYDIVPPDEPLLRLARAQLLEDMSDMSEEFFKDAKEVFEDAAAEFYKNLENEYDYLTSDEAVLEALLSNEDILKEDIQEYEDEHAEESEEELPVLRSDSGPCDPAQPPSVGEVDSVLGAELEARCAHAEA